MMLGILAEYICQKTGKKVIVGVPTAFLHAYQQRNYCPTASKVPEDINDPTVIGVFYCSFERLDVLDLTALQDAILLIDEFHELFFG